MVMRIQYENLGPPVEVSIEDALEYDGYSEPLGQVEDVAVQAQNARLALGRLCRTLSAKGFLNAHEILTIAGIPHKDCRFIAEE